MSRYSYAQQVCIKQSGLLLQRSGAIWPGCRIGVAVSGGVDSLVLLKSLKIRQAILPFPIEIMALHLNPGFNTHDHVRLLDWLANEGVASHIEVTDFGPLAHSDANRKNSPCFYCAWLRRKRLFDLCRQYKLTHLALGHNAEDMAATFLMNLLRNARVQGMAANEEFFNGKLHLIRPLLLVEKKYVRQAARQWCLPVWENACPSSGHTARAGIDDVQAKICEILPDARRSLLNGLKRWHLAINAGFNVSSAHSSVKDQRQPE